MKRKEEPEIVELRKLNKEELEKEKKKVNFEIMRCNSGHGNKLPPEKRSRFRKRLARINTLLNQLK